MELLLIAIFTLPLILLLVGVGQSLGLWRRRRSLWVRPENLAGQKERDARYGRKAFYVYVLAHDDGLYIGHSYHVGRRYSQHASGAVQSTAGLNPRLVWTSGRFKTRSGAAQFEAALKSLYQQKHKRFTEITGVGFGFDQLPRKSNRTG